MIKINDLKKITPWNNGWYVRLKREFAEASQNRDVKLSYIDKDTVMIKRIDLNKLLN